MDREIGRPSAERQYRLFAMERYELLDHTADIGIITYGEDLPEAFDNAAYAMFDIITDIDKVQEVESFDLCASADNIEELLVAWLNELLYIYDTERFICKRSVVKEINDTELCATVFGEKFDSKRHEIKVEIKSVTYHQLKLEKVNGTWKARVLFDV